MKFLCSKKQAMAATVACLFAGGPIAVGQKPDRPRIALDFKGPFGRTQALGFLEGNNRIFAAGQNKFVQEYHLADNTAVLGDQYRWEFARSQMGSILDVVTSPQKNLAFIAGASARGQRDVAIVDINTGGVAGTIPPNVGSKAHNYLPVLSLAISTDEHWLASAGIDGEIWLWDLSRGIEAVTGRKVRLANAKDENGEVLRQTINRVAFQGEYLLFSQPNVENFVQQRGLRVKVTAPNASPEVVGTFANSITGISASSDGTTFIIVDEAGGCLLERDGRSSKKNLAFLGEKIRHVTISPDGRLLAVTGDTADKKAFWALIDVSTFTVLKKVVVGKVEDCAKTAFSFDSSKLLTHDDSREVLLVYDLNQRDAKLTSVVHSRAKNWISARFLKNVSSSDTGYSLQLEDTDQLVYEFSASNGNLQSRKVRSEEIDADTFANDWEIQFPNSSPRQSFELRNSKTGQRHTVEIDSDLQGRLTGTHCFIPDSRGQPFAVAVGTDQINEVYVYRLTELTRQARSDSTQALVRHFRDHSGYIRDLSVSSDGKYLVSTSVDKTIKIWSLSGLQEPQRQAILGATVEQVGNTVRFNEVDPAGIVFARGIRNGDTVNRVGITGGPTGLIQTQNPGKMKATLATHSPLLRTYLWIDSPELGIHFDPRREAQDDRVIMVPGWEPLLTLIADRNDDWALFTPEGYYNASMADGNELFGWQINQGRSKTPIFEPASHLQKDFERPAVIQRVLAAGSVAAALKVPRANLRNQLQRTITALPRIQIISPKPGTVVQPGASVKLDAVVSYPAGTNPLNYKVSVSCNSRFAKAFQQLKNGRIRYSTDIKITDELNEILIGVSETNPGHLNNRHTSEAVIVRAVAAATTVKPKLFLFGVAAEQYQYAESLDYCLDDIDSIEAALRSHANLAVAFGEPKILKDADVTRANIQFRLREISEAVKARENPNDLVLIYVTGHGVLGMPDANGYRQFYFLPPAVDPKNAADLVKNGVSWPALSNQVNELHCNVIWCVDACHSGAAAGKESFRTSGGIHRRRRIWAAKANQEAIEDVSARVRDEEVGHGWFTMAVLETLIGTERNDTANVAAKKLMDDGALNFFEIAKHVRTRVSEATQEAQTPVYSPKPTTPKFIDLLRR